MCGEGKKIEKKKLREKKIQDGGIHNQNKFKQKKEVAEDFYN